MTEPTNTDCSICGVKFDGWGNNPAPFPTNEKERCCDDCNNRFVIPARLIRGLEDQDFVVLMEFARLARTFVDAARRAPTAFPTKPQPSVDRKK